MRKWNLPLTYEPKIGPVIRKEIRQTIRKGRNKIAGDLMRFYMWSGKPYRSPQIRLNELYMPITETIPIKIFHSGIWISPGSKEPVVGTCLWVDLDWLAALDGIVPATGKELGNVLMSKNKIPDKGLDAQIIRW